MSTSIQLIVIHSPWWRVTESKLGGTSTFTLDRSWLNAYTKLEIVWWCLFSYSIPTVVYKIVEDWIAVNLNHLLEIYATTSLLNDTNCIGFGVGSCFISMGWCKKDVTPLLTHCSYVFLVLTLWSVQTSIGLICIANYNIQAPEDFANINSLALPPVHAVVVSFITTFFFTNIHKRHSLARPQGRGMGCILWIQHLIDILPQVL